MSVIFIQTTQLLGENGKRFIYPNYTTGVVNGIPKQISTENIEIINSFWLVPKVVGGRVRGYTELVAANTSIPPTPDSIKVLRLKDLIDQSEFDIAITNTDNVSTSTPINQFAFYADGTGGSLPVMPTVTIPFPIIQYPPTTVSGSTNIFKFTFPSNPLGLLYSIPAPWFNGLAGAPAYAPTGITTAAGFVTWANSNWSAYGAWTSVGDVVTLTDTTGATKKAGLIVALTPKSYCFDLTAYSTPATVNQIKFGTGGTLINIPAFQLTNSPALLISVLQQYMTAQSTTFGTAIANKLQVNTVYDVPKLYNSGTLVVTSTAGVCS